MVLRSIERDGVRIAYMTGGRGRHTVILIHGAGSNASTWLRTAGALTGSRWIAVDTRGHGGSGGVPDIHATAEDIVAVADQEGIRTFSLAGICRGGTIALDIARRHPRRVRNVVVLSPFDASLTRCATPVKLLCRAVRACTRLFKKRRKLDRVDFRQPPPVPFLLTPLHDLKGIHTRHYCASALDSLEACTHFEGIRQPLLIITGSKDRFLRRKLLRHRLTAHDDPRWIEVDTNHHVLTWRPEEAGRHIAAFLRQNKQTELPLRTGA